MYLAISNFPCSLTGNIILTSHSMKNLAIHSLLRGKVIVFEFSLHLALYASLKVGNVYYPITNGSERVKAFEFNRGDI